MFKQGTWVFKESQKDSIGIIVNPMIPSNTSGVFLRTVLEPNQVLVAWNDGTLRIEELSALR